ncbi:16S rRNA processing protein RimM [Magnetococcus marinus MC-1]|uniref:Ribosome maturation factor RimM n=1 Tax=Magnetococcus marinus (strain ATCC BAA-1437 / JCM 17883 / MC-1) TaxID=156889 RepID=RIMM_MAGMM|nr:ribosome maturation factor RimM [Magnetococcus marinus]A0L4Y7.1 RecName: Full=Ribosome maturation factor RimM [Magnetococcus marinus MC-1]ABK43030.1 16S rRNA processing protein RimM [Magnetococcus marinus MC-1]
MSGTEEIRWVTLGYVMGAFGLKGEMRVRSLTERPDGIFDHPVWWLFNPKQKTRQEMRLGSGRLHGKGVVATLAGVTTREAVQALFGTEIQVPRSMLPDGGDDPGVDGIWADLIGCQVVEVDGTELGRVVEMMATGANDVLIVRGGPEGEKLLPYIEEVVVELDLDRQIIKVKLMEGM